MKPLKPLLLLVALMTMPLAESLADNLVTSCAGPSLRGRVASYSMVFSFGQQVELMENGGFGSRVYARVNCSASAEQQKVMFGDKLQGDVIAECRQPGFTSNLIVLGVVIKDEVTKKERLQAIVLRNSGGNQEPIAALGCEQIPLDVFLNQQGGRQLGAEQNSSGQQYSGQMIIDEELVPDMNLRGQPSTRNNWRSGLR